MTRRYGILTSVIGVIVLVGTVTIFFLSAPKPSAGQWSGFGLLIFAEAVLFAGIFFTGHAQIALPFKAGIYAVLGLYAAISAVIAALFGFVWFIGVARFFILALVFTFIAAILLLLFYGAGTRRPKA